MLLLHLARCLPLGETSSNTAGEERTARALLLTQSFLYLPLRQAHALPVLLLVAVAAQESSDQVLGLGCGGLLGLIRAEQRGGLAEDAKRDAEELIECGPRFLRDELRGGAGEQRFDIDARQVELRREPVAGDGCSSKAQTSLKCS